MHASTIPLFVTEASAKRVAQLGMHRELDLMVDWTRNNVPDLEAIRVTPGYGDQSLVVILAYRTWDRENPPTDLIEWDWAGWKAQTFPPRVCANFIMSSTFQPVPSA